MTLDLNSVADFSWSFGRFFYLETHDGLYEWSDPDYGGDNTIRRSIYSSLEERYAAEQTPTRCKGRHVISDYCGPNAKLVEKNSGKLPDTVYVLVITSGCYGAKEEVHTFTSRKDAIAFVKDREGPRAFEWTRVLGNAEQWRGDLLTYIIRTSPLHTGKK